MDNASKALIIAGGVLISIAIISLSLYLFSGARGIISASDKQLEASQIVSFNRYFQSYASTVNGAQAYSIINKINAEKESGYFVETINLDYPQELINEDSKNYTKKYSYSYGYDNNSGLVSWVKIEVKVI